MAIDKIKMLKTILKSANLYHQELENKEILLLVKKDKDIVGYKIEFNTYNFKHFTGVKSELSANVFYQKSITNSLLPDDFSIDDEFLVEKKSSVLESAMKLPYTAKMLGDFKYAGIKIEADLGAGNTCYIMAFRNKQGENLYPVSVMKEDVRNSTSPTSPIVAILRKGIKESIYTELTYKSKNINFDKLHFPKEIQNMISPKIMQQLKPQMNMETVENTVSVKQKIAEKREIIAQNQKLKDTTQSKKKSVENEL